MEAIYPISALQKDAAAVRRDAEKDIVRLTVDGRGKYVFCTEEVFEERVRRQADEMTFEKMLDVSLARSFEEKAAGNYRPMESSFADIRAERSQHAEG